jgi:hypothetical protein
MYVLTKREYWLSLFQIYIKYVICYSFNSWISSYMFTDLQPKSSLRIIGAIPPLLLCSWHGQTKLCITSYMLLVRYSVPGLPCVPCWRRARDQFQIVHCWHMGRWEVLSSGSSMAVLCLAIPGIVTMRFTLLVHLAKLPCLMSSPSVLAQC